MCLSHTKITVLSESDLKSVIMAKTTIYQEVSKAFPNRLEKKSVLLIVLSIVAVRESVVIVTTTNKLAAGIVRGPLFEKELLSTHKGSRKIK